MASLEEPAEPLATPIDDLIQRFAMEASDPLRVHQVTARGLKTKPLSLSLGAGNRIRGTVRFMRRVQFAAAYIQTWHSRCMVL